ncbi:MAG: Elongation factor P [Parcubacteria group bacterium GW2011_GWA2_51_12]|nr:MAG: Elongation factor P [Parcubacteria group bacterium GW2011_GWA2_51_12]
MIIDFSEIKKGVIIVWNSEPHEIMTSQFVRMQQRRPVMQTKMRNLSTGKVVEYSFKSGERVEGAEIIKHKAQYLYHDDQGAHFMDQETFDTITISKELSEDKVGYLKEGEPADLLFFNDKPLSIELPIKVALKVVSTPPGIKGDTATGGSKPATLETGLVVNVPLFIKEGDAIKVNTQTGEYAERTT